MKYLQILTAFLVFILIAGCSEEGRYPISGEECGPNDPVKELDTSDCLPPV